MTATTETKTAAPVSATPAGSARWPAISAGLRTEHREAHSVTTPLGSASVRPVDPVADAPLIHRWVSDPRAAFWEMGDYSQDQVQQELEETAANPDHDAWLVSWEATGEPVALVETYDPATSVLASVAPLQVGDVGMHILVGPRSKDTPAVSGLTDALMGVAMRLALGRRGAARVVVEPNVRNAKIAVKNASCGFVPEEVLDLPTKQALFSTATRAQFDASRIGKPWALRHLSDTWRERAHRHLVAKILSELTHERLFVPSENGDQWQIEVAGHRYTFAATCHELNHWIIDPTSISVSGPDGELPVNALDLVHLMQPEVGMPENLAAVYLEEVVTTIAGLARKWENQKWDAPALLTATTQEIEGAMVEGHPAFIANNGRIGLGLGDEEYTPEAGRRVQVRWLAARTEHAHLSLSSALTRESFWASQWDEGELAGWQEHARQRGISDEELVLIPVHPWQFRRHVSTTFADDLAAGRLVDLGVGTDLHQPQQSLRTLANLSRPERGYVKTAISVQNMGFLRGMSPKYMRATPAINDYVGGIVRDDAQLQEWGFAVLPEIAAVGYTGDAYHALGRPSDHTKMIAGLWRASLDTVVQPGEQVFTLAALLHRDREGRSFIGELIRASGISAKDWCDRMLRAYLQPLVRMLITHDLVFMPHSENMILVLQDHIPQRMIMKDIGEEVALLGTEGVLPPECERIRLAANAQGEMADLKEIAILTDVLDGVLRFVAGIVEADGLLDGRTFWALAGAATLEAQELSSAGISPDKRINLMRAEFDHSCLNRLQLRNTKQMVDLADQSASLIYAGQLRNPMAATMGTSA